MKSRPTPHMVRIDTEMIHEDLELYFSRYTNNDRLAMLLRDPETGEAWATCSVNLVEYDLPKNQMFLKNWGGQEGLPECLEKLGIVELLGFTVPSGWVDVPLAQLMIEPIFPEGDPLDAPEQETEKEQP